ncbi:unnamed protein product [Linum tenue]|uniref:Tyrosinase copper-binding domain-containing protein n=1 Tax=Linum tenue TaxID=586396 RepID=A0AAV0L826_9ROSI|nr:unnamed protein product [Linum tenue]
MLDRYYSALLQKLGGVNVVICKPPCEHVWKRGLQLPFLLLYYLLPSGSSQHVSMLPPAGGGGTSERLHNMAQLWTGGHNQQFGEDMGNFYSAGRDPIFYVHHYNVDRLWNV